MSNNNNYWGKQFGTRHSDGTPAFKLKKMANGANISGPHQLSFAPNSPRARQSKHDKELFAKNGMPVIVHKWPAMEKRN